jgi:hypothetical protein
LAYAHAWALTFYLAEREPKRFAEYLQRLERGKPFQHYAGPARLRDFTRVMGSDLRMLDARLQRFIETL